MPDANGSRTSYDTRKNSKRSVDWLAALRTISTTVWLSSWATRSSSRNACLPRARWRSTLNASSKARCAPAELTQQLLAYGRHQVLDARVFDLSATVDNMRRVLERLMGDDVELSTRASARSQTIRTVLAATSGTKSSK